MKQLNTVGALREALADIPDEASFAVYLNDWAVECGTCRDVALDLDDEGEEGWFVTLRVELTEVAPWDTGGMLAEVGMGRSVIEQLHQGMADLQQRLERIYGRAEGHG